jgi:hypothetical protein
VNRVVLGLLMVAGLLLQARPAAACTCAVRALPEQLESAAVVFTGTVRVIKETGDARITVAFDVSVVYKGDPGRRATVSTPQDSGACGSAFAQGGTYVVFGVGEPGALQTGICNGTTEDVSIITGLPPLDTFAPPDGELPGNEPGSRSLPIGTAAGLLTLVLSASMWAWMMRVRPPRPLA